MIEVRCKYTNMKSKLKGDYFIYTEVEVIGHAQNLGYSTNNKVCAGVSACCFGIKRLIDISLCTLELKSGYFKCIRSTPSIKEPTTDYALNTLVCQLYELYRNYPSSFKCFELIDIKENENGTKQNKQTNN